MNAATRNPEAPVAEELPPRPVRPAPEDCCGGNCTPCVFELYEQELERWERTVAEIRRRRQQRKKTPPDAKDRHS